MKEPLLMFLRNLLERATASVRRVFEQEHRRHIRYMAVLAIGAFIALTAGGHFFFAAPDAFPVGSLVRVEKGMTVSDAAAMLAERKVIRSEGMFLMLARIFGGYRGVIAGDYYFEVPESALEVAVRITHGEYNLTLVRVTIPEGATVLDIADVLEWKIPSFDRAAFLALAENKEGYLFPDTYFFLPNVEPAEIIRTMEENFDKKIAALAEKITRSGKSLSDVIVMASLVEKEAITKRDKGIVAGILWKRIEIGMPLQVDAPFLYAINKNTFDLTVRDLRTDSAYNTYTRKGLPATPIANPGLESILATLESEKTPYLFYLSDRRSAMHYARNFEEHKANKRRYLY